jgi:translation initiation factor IF-3
LRVNEDIRTKEVRVVGSDGSQLGIMLVKDALKLAFDEKLDLVEVAPTARPPVCRIMDYGRHKYEQSKRDKEAKKKQKLVTVKEVKIRPNIEEHDFVVKLKNVQRFIADGDKVKATVVFRGREITHAEQGKQVLLRLAQAVADTVIIEREPKLEGRNMIMILAPKPS